MTQHDIKEIARTAHALAEAARGCCAALFPLGGIERGK